MRPPRERAAYPRLRVIAALAVALSGAWWVTARHLAPPPAAEPAVPANVQVKFEQVTIRGRAGGDRRWELAARSIVLTRDQRLTRFEGLQRATLYAGDQPTLIARAGWAELTSPAKDIVLGGGVQVTSPSGLSLRAERLRWEARRERLDSESPVTISVGDSVIAARHAAYTAADQRIVCDGAVDIRQGRNRLRADRLVVDLAAQTTELVGGVSMRVQIDERAPHAGPGPLEAMPGLLENVPKEKR